MSDEDARRILKYSNSVVVDSLLGLGNRRFSTVFSASSKIAEEWMWAPDLAIKKGVKNKLVTVMLHTITKHSKNEL